MGAFPYQIKAFDDGSRAMQREPGAVWTVLEGDAGSQAAVFCWRQNGDPAQLEPAAT
ncbi:hypothetical protein [Azospirillum sp. B4]|uniref:hypothetical protein n=1 Tax=Azospirillum sp. B4 TaxID=95605 RepID=UPI000346FE27|nr:hypothetical protein [Azospirillum sp. B4]